MGVTDSLGKEVETGQLTRALTLHRSQNWVIPDKEEDNNLLLLLTAD